MSQEYLVFSINAMFLKHLKYLLNSASASTPSSCYKERILERLETVIQLVNCYQSGISVLMPPF